MRAIDEPVTLIAHRREWATLAVNEIARVRTAVGVPDTDVEHIGSTAVEGLVAKPTIDLILALDNYPAPTLSLPLQSLGYEDLGEAGVPGRTYFRRRGRQDFNLHVVARHSAHWTNSLALRTYLRQSTAARQRYAQAKHQALASGAVRLLAYSDAKSSVVIQLLEEALNWQGGIHTR